MRNGSNQGSKVLTARTAIVLGLVCACLLAGCSGPASHVTGTSNTGSVSLLMTDSAPSNVGVISFEVTLTSAILNPGNVQLITTPITIEVTRLQTDTALLATLNVTPGTFTSIALTYSAPELTFQNDTGSTISAGGLFCATGQICTISPTPATPLTGTVVLSGAGLTAAASTPAALLLDLNLATVISNTLTVDPLGGSSVSTITPAISGAPFATIEGQLGTITAIDSVHQNFTLLTSLGSYTVGTGTSSPVTAYSNFPSSACTTQVFACLAVGQIVSVNMNLLSVQTSGTLLALDISFEDTVSTQPEMEGVVVAKTGVTPPGQFRIVVLQETPVVSGVPIGALVDVEPSVSPAVVFDIDNLGASTSAFSFTGLGDLIVGQEVQVQRLSASTNSLIVAGRVRLRSSRFTANVSNTFFPNFAVDMLPALFGSAGISQVQINTSPVFTQFGGTAVSVTQIQINHSVSARGQLFANGSTPVAVATKVIQH